MWKKHNYLWWILLGSLWMTVGCDAVKSPEPKITLASAALRQSRRAYDGAPPVIPHQPQGAACKVCHTTTGKIVPELGFAPANPHSKSHVSGRTENCRQCHLFQRSQETFASNHFEGWRQADLHGDRLYPGAPPVIPHPLVMRDNCLSCHDGPSARTEIRCTHPQRTNCKQCHVAHQSDANFVANATH